MRSDSAYNSILTGTINWHIIALVLRKGIIFFKLSDISCLLRKGHPTILTVIAGPFKENQVALFRIWVGLFGVPIIKVTLMTRKASVDNTELCVLHKQDLCQKVHFNM